MRYIGIGLLENGEVEVIPYGPVKRGSYFPDVGKTRITPCDVQVLAKALSEIITTYGI